MRTGLLLTTATCLFLIGCAAPKKGDQAATDNDGWEEVEVTYRVITAPHTPLYRYGPAQATGPDTMLKKDALVALVKQERGFSRVRTENEIEGYVANDRLAEAPPDRLPSAANFMGLPEFRTDTTASPEWLEVGTVDEMLIQNPPGELLLPEEDVSTPEPPAPPAPAPEATPAPEPTPSTPTPNSNGQNDHQ